MRVEITFEEDALDSITNRTCDELWAIESESNRGAAESYWRDSPGAGGLTIFQRQGITELLPVVLEHHPDCDSLVVRGLEAHDRAAWDAARSFGFEPLRHGRRILRFGRRGNAA